MSFLHSKVSFLREVGIPKSKSKPLMDKDFIDPRLREDDNVKRGDDILLILQQSRFLYDSLQFGKTKAYQKGKKDSNFMALKMFLHKNDLPSGDMFKDFVAIDTEAMGLYHHRDRLCLVQLSDGKGDVHLVQIDKNQTRAPHLEDLLQNQNIQKIFHFARFDVALLMHTFKIQINNVYCTKIASKLCRTYTNKHGLKDLCKDLLSIEISKEEQTSDWGAPILSDLQKRYAASDVLHLHALKNILDNMLIREDRMNLALGCFNFIKTRAQLDLLTSDKVDIFSHHSD